MNRFDGALRIAAQVSFADTLLADWMEVISGAMPKVALHVEADYSPQMIDDIAFGNLDIGIMYAPRFLPEIGFEHIMTQRFLLVSSTATRCSAIELKSYIRAGYTPALEKSHSELLPELSRPRLSVGLDILAIEGLRRKGGTAYVPEHAVARLRSERIANVVQDAPVITQPVFSATHIRRRTSPYVKRALAGLKQLIATGRYGSEVNAGQQYAIKRARLR